MADCILNVEDINVYYGAIHAIKDVSFRVFDGEIVALIGANGAGKSTTLKTPGHRRIRREPPCRCRRRWRSGS